MDEGGADQVPGDEKQAEAPQNAAKALADNRMPRSLRHAARRPLEAWDDDANGRDGLYRRHGCPAHRPRREACAPPGAAAPAAAGNEALTVVAPPKQPGGTTVAQVREATGWTKDTVCGFFIGLNRAGGRGSYAIYRVAEAGDA